MGQSRIIKVFIASPGDLAEERRAFKEAIDILNIGFGDGLGVEFVGLGWEDTLASTGRRSQAVINREIDGADVFVLALNRRWGQEAPDAKPYSSYTEEEFHRAMDRWKKSGSPEIFVFFKHVDAASRADPGEQLKRVLAFRKSLEDSRQVLYHSFADPKEFAAEVDRHLRAFARGDLPSADAMRETVLLPLEYVQQVEQARAEAQQAAERADREYQLAEAAMARADALALEFAERAAKAAMDGKIEEARQDFAKALDGTTKLRVLFLGFEFFNRIGELDEAERLIRRLLALSGPDETTGNTAASYGNLGTIYQKRGDLDQAEAAYNQSLAINEKLGRLEGMAISYGNLGNIYKIRGDLDQAEAMQKKALAIDKKLGRLEGMAADYSNLGIIHQTRGDLDQAEAMCKKSLAIEQKLGRLDGMASTYGNLGINHRIRGDLDQAEKLHKKALTIDEKLGSLEGMAADYSSLGIIYLMRGDLDQAEAMYNKALVIDEKLGSLEGMAIRYGNLGIIYKRRGDLDQAEEMYRKSLAIEQKLGRLDGMASTYGNLGNIYRTRGDAEKARELWTQARDLFKQVGVKPEVAKVQELLDSLDEPKP